MTNPDPQLDDYTDDAASQGIALTISIAAAALLFVAGIISLFQGIAALADNNVFFAIDTPNADYIFSLNLTTWGWVHVVLGIIGIIVAAGLAVGSDWGRILAIAIACISIVAQFLWFPYYPGWAILIIVLDLIVIWAVATWRTDSVF